MGPHYGPIERTKCSSQLIHVTKLVRIGLVGGFKEIGSGIRLLQIDIDKDRLLTEAKAGAAGVILNLLVDLPRSEVASFHCYSCFSEARTVMI